MQKYDYLNQIDPIYIEELYERYLSDPEGLDASWRFFFDGLNLGQSEQKLLNGEIKVSEGASSAVQDLQAEVKTTNLILAYRRSGHLLAKTDPIGISHAHLQRASLDIAQFGLTEADLSRTVQAAKTIGLQPTPLSKLIQHLQETYCHTIGVEPGHVDDSEIRDWLFSRIEPTRNRTPFSPDQKKTIHRRLADADEFERFLHTRYVAQKRFSIEGGDSLIPALDQIIFSGAELGAQEFILGMAHRGRLNVLANTMKKNLEYIFTEFEGNYKVHAEDGEGDVKYHMGYSTDCMTPNGKSVHLSLGFNPSHLEFINPVAEGVTFAKQRYRGDHDRSQVVPILIHGDAAFAGQGICYETLNLSELEAYSTGGTIHIVLNNQVGFTTDPSDSRSTQYCTDLAKMIGAPIFHVNGDDPEAVVHVAQLAIEFRQKFKRDVFVDLVCYRRYGHNEGDEPSFTQPRMYQLIKDHSTPREIYEAKLIEAGVLSEQDAAQTKKEILARMTEAQKIAKEKAPRPPIPAFAGRWKGLRKPSESDFFEETRTQVPAKRLLDLTQLLCHFPEGFKIHPKLARFFEARLQSIQSGEKIDWSTGETLAYATLVTEGFPIRLIGQDVQRGTFTHRHAVLHDVETGQIYCPLQNLDPKQSRFETYNSLLSESAALGFEFGYSIADPQSLVIWEAQFGDFANGAQVIIDQFISSSESKWNRMSGLTLLLPHGYEGQGPEHSSARLERFLQLCARNNMQVCNFTTPAQIFHALRRQMLRDFRVPLVIMSPKSLLRHPMAVSSIDDFTDRGFQLVIDDAECSKKPAGIKKLALCSGKIYYDLLAEKQERKSSNVALVRVEQLYPWPASAIQKILDLYPDAKVFWVQEEPKNMGAWNFIWGFWSSLSKRPLEYIGRDSGAAPAVGSPKVHAATQQQIIEAVFGKGPSL